MEKKAITIFTAKVARELLKAGFTLIDIKQTKMILMVKEVYSFLEMMKIYCRKSKSIKRSGKSKLRCPTHCK